MVTSVLAAILVLGLLIFVHELGHFLAAKRVGVGVLRFSLGFGPAVFSPGRSARPNTVWLRSRSAATSR